MFQSLPAKFKEHGLAADVRTLLTLRKAMDRGLVRTMGDMYYVLKGIIVKDPKNIGPFSRAYYDYFLNIQLNPGETLDQAIERSITFKNWKEGFLEENHEREHMSMEDLINRFLDEVHLTSYDIKRILDGKDILAQDDPQMEDAEGQAITPEERRRLLQQAADYRGIDIDELLRRMEEVAKKQRDFHEGGSHWIGQGGISPYGFGGAAKGGIRMGGPGGGKMARMSIGDSRFYPVDMDAHLADDNMDAALAALKGVMEESANQKLDVPKTIKNGLKQGGLFLPEMEDIINEKMQIILLIDNGGYSMSPHVRIVQELFKKMKTRFAHDMETFYFHNTLYQRAYTDERRTKFITVDRLAAYDPNYCVFIVGDAAMAPYEMSRASIASWSKLKEKFKKIAWLNPEPMTYWNYSETSVFLGRMFDMFPLTPRGIEKAVREMNRKRRKR